MPDLSADERAIVAESLELLAEFYRSKPASYFVSPSTLRHLRKYGNERFESPTNAYERLTNLAEKVRAGSALS